MISFEDFAVGVGVWVAHGLIGYASQGKPFVKTRVNKRAIAITECPFVPA